MTAESGEREGAPRSPDRAHSSRKSPQSGVRCLASSWRKRYHKTEARARVVAKADWVRTAANRSSHVSDTVRRHHDTKYPVGYSHFVSRAVSAPSTMLARPADR